MMDFEKTFDEEREFYKNKIQTVCERLEKNNMHGYYAENRKQALEIVKSIVREADAKEIGIADSMSLHQIDFFDWLYSDENHFIIHNTFERLEDGRFSEFKGKPNDWIPAEEYNVINRRIWEKSRRALLSDVFLTGANAVTMGGVIVSVDGIGNRIAGVIYGPLKVIMVIGRNKIVENVDEAISRIRNVSTPLNHLRHATKHGIKGERAKDYGIYKLGQLPCVKKGHCIDCNSPMCSRHCTMIMERSTGGLFKDRINIVLVNENLGL